MIRVAVIDDHPSVRAGVAAALPEAAGFSVVGVGKRGADADSIVYRSRPAVVVLDYRLPDEDGIAICRRLKADVLAPAVILFSAFTTSGMAIAALTAGADGLIDKAASPCSLRDAIRCAARGERAAWALDDRAVAMAEASVDPADVALLQELLSGSTATEVMRNRRWSRAAYDTRVARILSKLHVAA